MIAQGTMAFNSRRWPTADPDASHRFWSHSCQINESSAITRAKDVRRSLCSLPMRLWLSLSSFARFANVASSPAGMRGPRADGAAGGSVGQPGYERRGSVAHAPAT